MNADDNNRTNRDQDQIANRKAGVSPTTQAATERAAPMNPRSAGAASPQSHNDYDEAERRKALDKAARSGEDLPDNQEGVGP